MQFVSFSTLVGVAGIHEPMRPWCKPEFASLRWIWLRLHTNLVDPASSHMLVSKIKPCMSQYKLLHGETANGSLKQLSFIWWSFITWITMEILELIHAPRPDFCGRVVFISYRTNPGSAWSSGDS